MKTIYALGYFDGVHLGHQALLTGCRELAAEAGCGWGVVTFLGHPESLLKGNPPGLINTPADRNRLLRQYGAEKVVQLPFDENMMKTPWRAFLTDLVKNRNAAGFVCGTDFRFGSGGEGTALLLQSFCREQGLSCRLVKQKTLCGIRISSTHIRTLLEQGKLAEAAAFSGHPHVLSGVVVPGKHLGRTIGVPTANLVYPESLLKLPHGVYVCHAEVEGMRYAAVTNIGTRPTVSGEGVTVESWLLDFSGDLYGEKLILTFYEFLRPEEKFENLSALKKRIENDKFTVENVIRKYNAHS